MHIAAGLMAFYIACFYASANTESESFISTTVNRRHIQATSSMIELRTTADCAINCLQRTQCVGLRVDVTTTSCQLFGLICVSQAEEADLPGVGVQTGYFMKKSAAAVNGEPNEALARGKPTKMIDEQVSGKYSSNKAVDGIYSVASGLESLVVSATMDHPWWRVDLLGVHCVWALNVFNRARFYWEGKINTLITVSSLEEEIFYNEDNKDVLCRYYEPALNRVATYLACNQPMTGQFVQLQLNSTGKQITLYEIEVHGY